MFGNVCMGIFECLRIQKRLKISTSACIHSTGRVCKSSGHFGSKEVTQKHPSVIVYRTC